MVFGIAVSVFSIYSHMAVGIVGMVNGVAVPACSTVFLVDGLFLKPEYPTYIQVLSGLIFNKEKYKEK